MTDEERRLGLDPSKYTKKPFNPQDHIGYSKETSSVPLFQVVEEMRQSGLENEQGKVLDMPSPDMSVAELEEQKRRIMQRMME